MDSVQSYSAPKMEIASSESWKSKDFPRGIPAWLGFAMVLGLWLLARPYIGVRHDGVLYMGQTLLQMQPDVLSKDLFFAFGSQDQFSLFSKLTAVMYGGLGMAQTQTLLLSFSHVPLLLAAAWLTKDFCDPLARWLGLAALASMSHFYGGLGVFAFAETFVTARTLAEPLVLLALVTWINGYRVPAGVLAIGAALIHPLVALPFFVIAWMLACHREKRWLWLLILVPLGLAVAWFLLPRISLWQTFDQPWWDLVKDGSAHVLVSHWRLSDWSLVALDAVILRSAASQFPRPLSNLCLASLLTALALIVVSAVTVDLMHNVLFTGLQVWRSVWVIHLLSLLCLPALLLKLWHSPSSGPLAATAAALAALAVNASWETAWAFEIWAVLVFWIRTQKIDLSPILTRLLNAVHWVAILGITAAMMNRNLTSISASGAPLDAGMWLWVAVTLPSIALPLAYGILVAQQRGHAATAAVLAMTLAVVGGGLWDRRPEWIRFIETAQPGEHPFSKWIPPQAQVYWQGELSATWHMLGRPSYFSNHQGAGLLFNRSTAMEFLKRKPAVAGLLLQQEVCSIVALAVPSVGKEDCAPDPELILDVCRYPDGPDFLVIPYKVGSLAVADWTFRSSSPDKTYSLYDCKRLNALGT